jgi:hypothetical protein
MLPYRSIELDPMAYSQVKRAEELLKETMKRYGNHKGGEAHGTCPPIQWDTTSREYIRFHDARLYVRT